MSTSKGRVLLAYSGGLGEWSRDLIETLTPKHL
jgi:hypothetical protein